MIYAFAATINTIQQFLQSIQTTQDLNFQILLSLLKEKVLEEAIC